VIVNALYDHRALIPFKVLELSGEHGYSTYMMEIAKRYPILIRSRQFLHRCISHPLLAGTLSDENPITSPFYVTWRRSRALGWRPCRSPGSSPAETIFLAPGIPIFLPSFHRPLAIRRILSSYDNSSEDEYLHPRDSRGAAPELRQFNSKSNPRTNSVPVDPIIPGSIRR
jgi:hypothetical protein